VEAVYRVWSLIVVAAVLLQIGFAGYGAFYVANKVDDNPVNDDTFMDGWGLHSGFGYLVVLLGLVFLLIALGSRGGRQRTLRVLGLFGLLILQVLLAWFGFEIPFIGFFHPINAFLILGLSGSIAYQAWRGPARVQTVASEPAA
jgi:hypothetical protein